MIALLGSAPALAAPGALDPSFGSGGVVIVPSGPAADGRAAIQADGSIVVAVDDGVAFSLKRYTSTGALDTTFGTNGVAPEPSCGNVPAPTRITFEPDGKIVVAGPGSTSGGAYDGTYIARFLSNGDIDTGFGSNGCTSGTRLPDLSGVSQPEASIQLTVASLLVEPNGRIILGAPDGGLYAYTPQGAADASFGVNGFVQLPTGVIPWAMAMEPDGRLVVGGTTVYFPFYPPDSTSQFMLARVNTDGSIDKTFGTNGVVALSPVSGQASALRDLVIQPDGHIVAVGETNDFPTGGTDGEQIVLRLDTAGSLDKSFGSAGAALLDVGNPNYLSFGVGFLTGVVLEPDGKILLTGIASGSYLAEVTRLNADGSYDTAFGTGGVATNSLPAAVNTAVSLGTEYPVLVSPDGTILTMGNFHDSNSTWHFYLERLIANDPGNTGHPAPWGLEPAAISFPPVQSVPLGSAQQSALATISGLDAGVSVPALVANGESALGGSQSYDASIKWVANGAQIGLEQQASSAPNTTTSTTLTIGGIPPTESPGYPLGAVRASTFSSTTTSTVTIPNVTGSSQKAAESALSAAYLTFVEQPTPSETASIGTVLSQSPAAGAQLTAGSAVTLAISSGIAVPSVVGQTQTAATSAISGAGLTVGTVTRQASTTAATGLVTSESPAAGVDANPGSPVDLVVSSGTSVPDVSGKSQSDAKSALESAGLAVGTVTQQSSGTIASGLVISQTPAVGASADPGTAVSLVISSGPPTAASSSSSTPPTTHSSGGGGGLGLLSLLILSILAAGRARRGSRDQATTASAPATPFLPAPFAR